MSANATPAITDFLAMKNILDPQGFYRPSKSDFDDATWLLTSCPLVVELYERSVLEKLIQAFKANEAMLVADYNEAKFIISHILAAYDDLT